MLTPIGRSMVADGCAFGRAANLMPARSDVLSMAYGTTIAGLAEILAYGTMSRFNVWAAPCQTASMNLVGGRTRVITQARAKADAEAPSAPSHLCDACQRSAMLAGVKGSANAARVDEVEALLPQVGGHLAGVGTGGERYGQRRHHHVMMYFGRGYGLSAPPTKTRSSVRPTPHQTTGLTISSR
jgi:hypothetical protein